MNVTFVVGRNVKYSVRLKEDRIKRNYIGFGSLILEQQPCAELGDWQYKEGKKKLRDCVHILVLAHFHIN